MELKKIYFDSFKSLINEQLEISENCIGIVGINESGKSNILEAVKILKSNNSLTAKDSPKINKKNPKLRYVFEISESLKSQVLNRINSWLESSTLIRKKITHIEFNVEYTIEYDLIDQTESRSFRLIDTNLIDNKFKILLPQFLSSEFKILINEEYISLNKAILINSLILDKSYAKHQSLTEEASRLEENIKSLNEESQRLLEENKEGEENKNSKRLKRIETDLTKYYTRKEKLDQLEKEFNQNKSIEDINGKINELENENQSLERLISQYKTSIYTLKIQDDLTTVQKSNLTKFSNSLEQNLSKFEENKKELEKLYNSLNDLNTPLHDKYTENIEILENYLVHLLDEDLKSHIPEVIFWKHSPEYILEPKNSFQDILSLKSIDNLSRPLRNVFRIGLDIEKFEDLEKVFELVKNDGNERSKLTDKLNKKLNSHIKNIWGDYDQNIKIQLEENQIRIEFYDPNFEDRSYFIMSEKSQGAQTFISFLLTIGAEAANGVLRNKILLLDEPEIHLHPSGVRYMLQELIKISEKNNVVLYATHSIFMIDRKNYERHIYLKKIEERTSIKPSQINRIGFFMQEEVLYEALNINLSEDFNNTNLYNFVFEGDGDALLFEHFYEHILDKVPLEKKNCSFYQGGKCTDILKYLKNNPVQLGSKWIFILDNDEPANKLRKFIESKYKNYINSDLFVYQYESTKGNDDIELEDLLPNELIEKTYKMTIDLFNRSEKSKISKMSWNETKYCEYNNDILHSLDLDESKKEQFKGRFKENLNRNIKELLETSKTVEDFEKKFQEYFKWINGIIDSLKKSFEK